MKLEVLHVPDCPNLPPLLDRLAEITDVPVTTRLVQSDAEAAEHGMAGSPTLLIDGVDPFAGEEPCECGVACRLFRDEHGRLVPIPTAEQLRDAIIRTATTGGVAALTGWRQACRVSLDPVERAVHQAILAAFATTSWPPQLAELSGLVSDGRGIEAVLAGLHRRDVIRLDAEGRIAVAYPFSAAPTGHRVRIGGPDGVTVSAMCAVDALGISAMLGGRDTVIESVDAATGAPITITTCSGRTSWQPADAVVFLSTAAGDGPSADCCCRDLNFFTDRTSAQAWSAAHPQVRGDIVDQATAELLGADLFGQLLTPSIPEEGS
ncbi:alkylmercury lyase family protein [Microlunatus parietis]|uniref:Alkylmercury lyase n=1 Tax=Microlunatus parietis TaxID=682979 RepID=A0A7Y9I4W3_9ACTN|nr:alkylmercury lyase family protein [Microlunatus parietis]NYE70086.1 hypothetical protein [Microlunatus parietis]